MSAAPRPETLIDFRNPNYGPVLQARTERLARIRANPECLKALKLFYRDHPAQFIDDWAMTLDPRIEGRSPLFPFVLFPKQREQIAEMLNAWKDGRRLEIVKSRDVGASWIMMALFCTLALFRKDFHAGVGSRVEDKVDRSGDPDTLFYKARMFLEWLPVEFRGGWDRKKHSAHMRIVFPETGSSITGEAGDQIGRGGRKAIYGVDEAAFLERPKLAEASLSATARCRIDVSSVNGAAGPFYEHATGGKTRVFAFHWRDDPRKDDAWYRQMCEDYDAVTVASELDLNWAASIEGQIIPSEHVQAAIDAHLKLALPLPTGERIATFDLADQGQDKCAMGFGHGWFLEDMEQWSGKLSDPFQSSLRALEEMDRRPGYGLMRYDADGMGAAVRGDVSRINEDRKKMSVPQHRIEAFRGSGAVINPEAIVKGTIRKNKDFFENFKAQSWWEVKRRFAVTYNAVVNKQPYKLEDVIVINGKMKLISRLVAELSQPTWERSKLGKWMVNKTPDDQLSPNLADNVMMRYAPQPVAVRITDDILRAI